jgi:hypothetical protein
MCQRVLISCSLHLIASVAALALLMSRLPPRFSTDLTSLWAGLADDRKWRKDIAESMLRAKLLNGPEVDTHLCKVLQISRSATQPVEFAVHIVRSNSPPIWHTGMPVSSSKDASLCNHVPGVGVSVDY